MQKVILMVDTARVTGRKFLRGLERVAGEAFLGWFDPPATNGRGAQGLSRA